MACAVQVRGSPGPLGTGAAELPSPLRSVCRRLFVEECTGGRAPETDRAAFLRAVEADLQRRARERWNFDFGAERPLPGRYQWTDGQARPDRGRARQGKRKATQSKITDFLLQRKRLSTPSEVSGSLVKAKSVVQARPVRIAPTSTVD